MTDMNPSTGGNMNTCIMCGIPDDATLFSRGFFFFWRREGNVTAGNFRKKRKNETTEEEEE